MGTKRRTAFTSRQRQLLTCGLVIFIFCLSIKVNAQAVNEIHLKEIKERSELWNTANNSRDSLTFYKLFATHIYFFHIFM
jgi:hypothetical protein